MPTTQSLVSSYQLKITLDGSDPPIWRRFQVPASITLANLHFIIQTVMGWQNYHLHEFQVGKRRFADEDPDAAGFPFAIPSELLLDAPPDADDLEPSELPLKDELAALKQLIEVLEDPATPPDLSRVLIASLRGELPAGVQEDEDPAWVQLREVLKRARSKMTYTYDFGDGWSHTIVVESTKVITRPDQPAVCLDGAGACPPEDCGGIWRYQSILETIAHPDDPRYDEEREWLEDWLGDFDPNGFSVDDINRHLAGYVWSLDLG
jgi:hypothetical protein